MIRAGQAATEPNALRGPLRRTSVSAIRQSVRVLILFEGWNVMVIVMSLGGFAHVLTLTGASWASYLLWLIAVVTGVITGAAVGSFVWFARSTVTA